MNRARALALAVGLTILTTAPACAFECAKASTPNEKAICADPAARTADANMSLAYAALAAPLPPSQKAQLASAQMEWLRGRDRQCADMNGAALAGCLTQASDRRREFLGARPEAGPGAPGRLAPWFRIEKGGKGKAAVDFQTLRFPAPASPAERAFNAASEKLVPEVQEPGAGDPAADRYAYEISMRLAYASPRLISAVANGYLDTGGAHPNSFTGSINIDAVRGRELSFADLVDLRGARSIFAFCYASVVSQKQEKLGADAPLAASDRKELAKEVEAATSKLSAWSFGAAQATVTYDPYAVGSYAEGPYDCVVPYETLRPLAKASFPLP